MKKIISLIVLFLYFLFSFNFFSANAEIVKPVYKQLKDSNVDGVDNFPSPTGVNMTPDGKKMFIMSHFDNKVYIYDLTTPFDISTMDVGNRTIVNTDGLGDNLSTAAENDKIKFNNDGTKVFFFSATGHAQFHNLATPYDVASISASTIIANDGINYRTAYSSTISSMKGFAFNNDGTKMYLSDGNNNTNNIVQVQLSTPYDPSSGTFEHNLDTNSVVTANPDKFTGDIAFDDDGTRLYLTKINNNNTTEATFIYVWKLYKPFELSSANYVDKYQISGNGNILSNYGWTFGKDGMKLYLSTEDLNNDGDDRIYEYDLICPYGIVICENDNDAIVSSQIDTAKSIISINTSYIFKRFDWIKRNDNNENLNSKNINIKVHNPILASLKNKLQSSLKNNKKNNTSDWSLWTHGDISIGRVGDKNSSTPKEVEVYGIMIGADKKLKNNKIMGAALRYGNDKIDLETNPVDEINTDSLSLNLYGTLISNEKINFNMVLGISALRIDQLSSGNITGERNGKQIFTGLNLLSNKSTGNSKLTPTAKFEFGITELSEYTDFGFVGNPGDIIYDKLTFETGNVSMGVKYNDLENYSNNNINFNGSLEYINDFTSDIDYKMRNTVDNISVIHTLQRHSTHNLKANFGFERLFDNNKTFSVNYERLQGLSESSYQDSLFIKLSTARENDEEFSFNLNPLEEGLAMLEYKKAMDLFDLKVNSDYKLNGKIPYYNLNLLISNSF